MATMDELRGELNTRASGLLAKMGVTWEGLGPLPDLDRPILFGMSMTGLATISGIEGMGLPDYAAVDHAELRLLKTFLGRFTDVTAKVEGGEVRLSDLRTSVEARVKDLEKSLGLDVPPLRAGRIALRSGPDRAGGGHDWGGHCR